MPGNLCLVLEGKPRPSRRAINRERLTVAENGIWIKGRGSYLSLGGNQNQFVDAGGVDDRRQHSVLIRVVETVGHIEEVAGSAGERLKRLKDSLGTTCWRFYSVTRSFVTRSVASFREVELLMLAAAIKPDQRPSEVVHGAPQIVDSIAYYQGDAVGRRNDGEHDIQFPIISIMDRRIEALPSELGKLPFEVSDMMIGPFDL